MFCLEENKASRSKLESSPLLPFVGLTALSSRVHVSYVSSEPSDYRFRSEHQNFTVRHVDGWLAGREKEPLRKYLRLFRPFFFSLQEEHLYSTASIFLNQVTANSFICDAMN